MTLPPDLAEYQAAYDALAPAEQKRVDAMLAKSDRAFNYLMGQVMQATGGRANPHLVRQILRERLDALPIEADP